MKKEDLVTIGEAFERLSRSPDFEFLKKYIQSQIQLTSSRILQGSYKEFPKEHWKDQGRLEGLAMINACMETTIKAMKSMEKKDRSK